MNRLIRLLALALVPLALGAGAKPPPPTLSPRVRLAARLAEAQAAARPESRPGLPAHLAGAILNPNAAAASAETPYGASNPAPGTETGRAAAPASETRLQVLIETDAPFALIAAGFDVRTVAGPVVTAAVPLGRLAELAAVEGVRKVDLSLPVSPKLDLSMPEIRADEVHGVAAPPYPETGVTGRGVVVGVIDTGVDLEHDDFRDETGATRISWIWDQRDNGGPAPAGFGYGAEWTGAQIDAGLCRQRDDIGHGTHVTGIAAGNGRGAANPEDRYRYVGVAPEAEIIAVKAVLNQAEIIDAVSWIFERAGDKPCVINLSIGSQTGPHDGTTPMDRALAGLAGPGRILVGAAGNESGSELHAGAVIPPGASVDIEFGIYPYIPLSRPNTDFLELEAWYPGNADLRFLVISPAGHATGTSAPGETRTWATPDGAVFIDHRRDPINGDYLALIDVYDETETLPPSAGIWKVRVHNPTSGDVPVDLWVSYDALGLIGAGVFFASHVEDAKLVDSPATSDSVIAVAAYVTKYQWSASDGKVYEYDGVGRDIIPGRLAPWSSPGPRRDGAIKPDIAAPGMGIASAISAHGYGEFTDPRRTTSDLNHVMSQGTSQASPHVAGVAALVLQEHPTVGVRDLLTRLRSSARTDPFTGTVPNARYGYGKIDAVGAVDPPVLITRLTAAWEAGAVTVRWALSQTTPEARFQVERGPAETGPFNAVSGVLTGEEPFSWVDPDPDEAEPWYRVRASGPDERTAFFGPVRLDPLAARVRLWQNAPNPVREHTVMSFDLERPQDVKLELFDVSGRRLAILHEGPLLEGRHHVDWYGVDAQGRRAAAGVYFYRLTTPGSVLSRRLIVTR